MGEFALASEDVYFNDRWIGDLFETILRVGKVLGQEIIQISHLKRALLVAGPGNNGNDVLSLANFLLEDGWQIKILELFTNESAIRSKLKSALPSSLFIGKLEDLPRSFEDESVFIDGIFGVGQRFPLENSVLSVLAGAKAFQLKIAIDVPTGVDANSGKVDFTIPFDFTLCVQQPKLGMFLDPAKTFAGKVIVVDAGIKTFKYSYCCFNSYQFSPRKIRRDPSSHKYFYGPLAVIAGSRRMRGAGELALEGGAFASSRVFISVAGSSVDPEVISYEVPSYAKRHLEKVFSLIKRPKCVVFGPGIEEVSELEKEEVVDFLCKLQVPVIIDGTGLKYIIGRKLNLLFLLTPHLGEFRYLGGDEQNLHLSLSDMQEKYNCNILLKGPVCWFRGRRNFLFEIRKSNLSFAGMGDFLAGLIGGFVCNLNDFFSASYNALGLLARFQGWSFKLFREKVKNDISSFFFD